MFGGTLPSSAFHVWASRMQYGFGVEECEDDAGEDGADAFEKSEAVHSVAVFAAGNA